MANETPEQPNALQSVPETLTPQQAIHVLIQCAEMAQKAGLLSLKDAATVNKAVDVFVSPEGEAAAQPEAKTAPKKSPAKKRGAKKPPLKKV